MWWSEAICGFETNRFHCDYSYLQHTHICSTSAGFWASRESVSRSILHQVFDLSSDTDGISQHNHSNWEKERCFISETHTHINKSKLSACVAHTPGETRRNCSPFTCPLIFREELKLSDVLCRNTQLINSADEDQPRTNGRFHSNTKQNSE